MAHLNNNSMAQVINVQMNEQNYNQLNSHTHSQASINWTLAFLAVMVGVNLRPIMASVSPIIPILHDMVGMDNQTAGLLTTLPVAMMGIFALFSPRLQAKVSEYQGVMLSLFAIAFACLLRFFIDSTLPILATAIIGGIGIALIQTLMPAYLKRMASDNTSVYMGLFTTGTMGGAMIASASSAPLAQTFGWQTDLAIMAIPAFIAMLFCFFSMHRLPSHGEGFLALPIQSKNAWLLLLFFGIGSGAYALVLAWLPLYYMQLGWSSSASGGLLSLFTIAQVVSGTLISIFIKRFPDRRRIILLALSLVLLGLAMLIMMPASVTGLVLLSVSILGLGVGGLFPLSLITSLDYANNGKQAVCLLAFVQGGGYFLASIFPLVAGALVDVFGSLTNAWIMMIVGVLFLLALSRKFHPTTFKVFG
ncbi:MFS transporter [Psychrobacter sp. I-STPA6b]|uniref:MFS transporter n=1 Tax=Psychrobacter sp. I-STPA6b TaxID=2585718 RepID=UPI001D0C966D|nr:MFS transporter [Psychrobacter sp. I-STPA6b]